MIKNNLKLNDTFLVTVEIISANAIIVSANFNSIIYRGALIESNKNLQFRFNNENEKTNSFSSQRLNVTEVKRNVKLKSFKSDYNLRRSNQKIMKAKQIVCKLEMKEAEDIPLETKRLSLVLKKYNGVYKNMQTLETKTLKRKLTESSNETTSRKNIIKIRKIKLNSDQYQYSISTDESRKKALTSSPFIIPENSLPTLLAAPSFTTSFSVDIKPPIYPPSLTSWDANIYTPISSHISTDIKMVLPINTQSLIISHPVTVTQPLDISNPTITTQSTLSTDLSRSPNISTTITPDTAVDSTTLNTSNNTLLNIPINRSITKLKIVKNPCNKYEIKPTSNNEQQQQDFLQIISKRYNYKHFRKDDIIWAKLAGYSIWPAKIIDNIDDTDHVVVLWYGNGHRTSRLHRRKICDFGAHFHEKFNRKGKGHYLDAVQQAQIDYRKIDFTDTSQWQKCDISSESSTLESVNIDDSSCDNDRVSCHDLRTNVYLPIPEDEEFELSKPFKDTHSFEPFFFESCDDMRHLAPLDINI